MRPHTFVIMHIKIQDFSVDKNHSIPFHSMTYVHTYINNDIIISIYISVKSSDETLFFAVVDIVECEERGGVVRQVIIYKN